MKEKKLNKTFWSGLGIAVASLIGSLSLLAVASGIKTVNLTPPPTRNQSLNFSQQKTTKSTNPISSDNVLKYSSDGHGGWVVDGFDDKATSITDNYSLVIPAEHGGGPVTKIAKGAFTCGNDTGLKIETKQNANKIISISIPTSVTEIGVGAFYQSNIKKIEFDKKSQLKTIGDYAFYQCKSLNTAIVFPATLKNIGAGAFWDSELKAVCIPENVTNFDRNIFVGCNKLMDVLITNSSGKCTFLSNSFGSCGALTNVTLLCPSISTPADEYTAFAYDSNAEIWASSDAVVNELLGNREKVQVKSIKKITTEKNFYFQNDGKSSRLACLTKTGANAKELTIPANVTAINNFAFSYNTGNLKKITINGNKLEFSKYAFDGVPANVKFYVYNDDVKNNIINYFGGHSDIAKRIVLIRSLSAGTIAAIVTVVVILAIAGLGTSILIPMRKQHKVNLLNSKLTNRRIDSLARSNALAFKKVIEVSGTLNKKVDQLSSGRTNNPMHNQPGNMPPRPPRPFPPQRTQQGY